LVGIVGWEPHATFLCVIDIQGVNWAGIWVSGG
jgi:hypothetical protein